MIHHIRLGPGGYLVSALPAMFDLSGRVAVVTGGGGALGRVTAAGLAAAGASIAVVDLSESNAMTAADEIVASGAQAIAIGADLASEVEVDRVFGTVEQIYGRVDV